MIFGCPPQTGVPAKSTIVKSVIECVSEHLAENGGVLLLPEAFLPKFKRDYEKSSIMSVGVTSYLYFDTTKTDKTHADLDGEAKDVVVHCILAKLL